MMKNTIEKIWMIILIMVIITIAVFTIYFRVKYCMFGTISDTPAWCLMR